MYICFPPPNFGNKKEKVPNKNLHQITGQITFRFYEKLEKTNTVVSA